MKITFGEMRDHHFFRRATTNLSGILCCQARTLTARSVLSSTVAISPGRLPASAKALSIACSSGVHALKIGYRDCMWVAELLPSDDSRKASRKRDFRRYHLMQSADVD